MHQLKKKILKGRERSLTERAEAETKKKGVGKLEESINVGHEEGVRRNAILE